jgi:uncharacterized protein
MIDQPLTLGLLVLLGIFTGAVAGVLGIGGGLLIVPALTLWQISLVQATATSLVGVLISAISGSAQNWLRGTLNWRASLGLAMFGIPTAQLGAWLGDRLSNSYLAFSFAALMLLTIYLLTIKQKLKARSQEDNPVDRNLVRVGGIGLFAGLLSGLFGVGGGAIMVPLQMLFLNESIKSAVRTSLGAIVAISASGLIQHTLNRNVLWTPGLALALGGMLGAQFGTRLLPRLSDHLISQLFRGLLLFLSLYMIWQGLQ